MFGKSLKKLTVAVFGTKKHRDTMFPPLFPLKVPSPPADKKFCARRRPSEFLRPTATGLPKKLALLALPCGIANLDGPAARAELSFAALMWELSWERGGTMSSDKL